MNIRRTCIVMCLLFAPAGKCFAQFPQSVTCQFEKIAIAELGADGKIVTSSEKSTGDIVISNLNSETPIGTGNMYTTKLRVLSKSKDTIWLAEYPSNINSFSDTVENAVVMITLFFKTGIVMQTKHEIIHSAPFGFVEIGRFRVLK